jgi:hypothetical protein
MAHVIAATTRAQDRIHEYSNDLRAASDAVERGLVVDARRLLSRHLPLPGDPTSAGSNGATCGIGPSPGSSPRSGATRPPSAVSPSPGRALGGVDRDGWPALSLESRDARARAGVDLERRGLVCGTSRADGRSIFSSLNSTNAAVWSLADGRRCASCPAPAALAISAPILAGVSLNPFMESRPRRPSGSGIMPTGKMRELPEPGRVAALSPDGRLIAVGLARSNVVVLSWSSSNRVIATLETPVEAFSLAFAPDGSGWPWPAVTNPSGFGTCRDPEPGTRRSRTDPDRGLDLPRTTPTRAGSVLEEGHWLEDLGRRFSPDGRRLASTSSDRSLRIWDAETLRRWRRLSGHADEVWCVAWGPDGQSLITGGKDGWVLLWRLRPTPNQAVVAQPPMECAGDFQRWTTHLDPLGPERRGRAGALVGRWPAPRCLADRPHLRGVDLRRAGARVGYGQRPTPLWSADHNAPVSTRGTWTVSFPATHPPEHGSGLTPDGRIFFALRTNGLARVWNATTGQLRARVPDPASAAGVRPIEPRCPMAGDQPGVALRGLPLRHADRRRARSPRPHRVCQAAGILPDSACSRPPGSTAGSNFGKPRPAPECARSRGIGRASMMSASARMGAPSHRSRPAPASNYGGSTPFLEVTSIAMPDAGRESVFSPAGDRLAVVRTDGRVTFLDARPVP